MKLDPYPLHKTQLQMDQRFNMKPVTLKLLKEQCKGVGKNFVNMTVCLGINLIRLKSFL